MMDYYLGLDPSALSAGYCVIDSSGQPIVYGKWSYSECNSESLLEQQKELDRLLEEFPCKKAFCEDQFFGNNPDTLKKLSRVTGVMLMTCAKHGIEVELVYPAQWRKIFHGDGKKHDKRSTFNKVVEDYGFKKFKFTKDNDITDAVGIAKALQMAETEAEVLEN
jgi:Holliday junction resolvasome RuvABC endonuclease subunit